MCMRGFPDPTYIMFWAPGNPNVQEIPNPLRLCKRSSSIWVGQHRIPRVCLLANELDGLPACRGKGQCGLNRETPTETGNHWDTETLGEVARISQAQSTLGLRAALLSLHAALLLHCEELQEGACETQGRCTGKLRQLNLLPPCSTGSSPSLLPRPVKPTQIS